LKKTLSFLVARKGLFSNSKEAREKFQPVPSFSFML